MELLERLEEEESILQELRAPVCRCCRSRLCFHGKLLGGYQAFWKSPGMGTGWQQWGRALCAITAPRASVSPSAMPFSCLFVAERNKYFGVFLQFPHTLCSKGRVREGIPQFSASLFYSFIFSCSTTKKGLKRA